ncbi:FAD-dependent oxidoreductase [uncultured Anaerococcus sp.]|uniref:FAD-dependent oxidoreductase n=1 Tax=uncultured Anaerococcus sp. TaxID=293428 RepID=UPI00288A70C4|nr:FAD-dependent oxidoreductase [uncultured Anaerococcus sp.]
MSEYMRLIEFPKLIEWALEEYKNEESVFSISKEKFYKNTSGKSLKTVFGDELGSAVGPAAGPHTQLAQNLIASYLAGGRYMELKTCQIMDGEELMAAIPKPCINSEDEAYNCEWSTELKIEDAAAEYIKAEIAIRVLAKEFGIADKKDFVLNMSVGYNLEGIKSPKVDNFINSLMDASQTEVFKESIAYLKENIGKFENVNLEDIEAIDGKVCNSMTLSTMHGTPAGEIEEIAAYLIKDKGLNTFVKCNPTLVGYDYAREILNKLGYKYIDFDKAQFDHDLSFGESIEIFTRLLELGKENNLVFGCKLSNTFPVIQKRGELPSDDMYMSGRALLPLTISAAYKLSKAFDGKLPMSYCGGADGLNIKEIFEIFNQPITVSTTLLKPGGYYRLKELAEETEELLGRDYQGIDNNKLKDLVDKLDSIDLYKKNPKQRLRSRNWQSDLPLVDCYSAPCKEDGCPLGQQVSAYLHYAELGDYKKAMETIAIDNTAPSILATTCYEFCKKSCTRVDYEAGVNIREVKKEVVDAYYDTYIENLKSSPIKTENKAIIIGGGPAGIAVGIFLRRNGLESKVLEKSDKLYGYANELVSEEVIEKDIKLLEKVGVSYELNNDKALDIAKLKEEYKYLVIATGSKSNIDNLKDQGVSIDKKINLLDTKESNIENVYFAGDITKGRKSIVNAIADAKIIAKDILKKEKLENDFIEVSYEKPLDQIIDIRGNLELPKEKDAVRCLSCDNVCEVCTEVCPNRANVAIIVDGFTNKRQTIHLDGLCNECGNCESFCPHKGAPYKDKFTVFKEKIDFDMSEQIGILKISDDKYLIRLANKNVIEAKIDDPRIDETFVKLIKALEARYSYYL